MSSNDTQFYFLKYDARYRTIREEAASTVYLRTTMDLPAWMMHDRTMLLDRSKWGRGFGKPLTEGDLDETAGYLREAEEANEVPAGYGRRMFVWTPGFTAAGRYVLLPPGYDAVRQLDESTVDSLLIEPDNRTSTKGSWVMPGYLQEYYRQRGWRLDQHGRPCHPHGMALVKDERIGLNAGMGIGYEYGEKGVVDVVATDGRFVLLNTRVDLGQEIPSLVGGYSWATDYGVSLAEWRVGNRPITHEGIYAAAKRVVRMKTGVQLPDDARYEIVWAIRPTSSVHTWNFWTVTYTVLVQLQRGTARTLTPARDKDGQAKGTWHSHTEAESLVPDMWPDHRRGFKAAFSYKS